MSPEPHGKPEPEPGVEACAHCRFFVLKPELDNDLAVPQSGHCRRNAPRSTGNTIVPWPWVKLDDWCGEYSALAVAREEMRLRD